MVSRAMVAGATKDMPLIPANKSKFWEAVFSRMIYSSVEKNFHSIRIKNKYNYYLGNPNYPNLLYSLHSCYHDGQVAYYICKKLFDANLYMMIQELYRLPALAKIGGFSVEKHSPLAALKSANYAADLLENKDNTLWIFPQGRVMPQDFKPIKFENGLSYICNRAKKVNLIPFAIKYTFARQQKPEIFVDVGEPIIIDNGVENRRKFTNYLESNLTSMIDLQSKILSQGRLDDYEMFYENQLSFVHKYEHILKYVFYDRRYL